MRRAFAVPFFVVLFAANLILASVTVAAPSTPPPTNPSEWFPGLRQTNLVANHPKYRPQILEPNLKNAWGIAIRPAGFGGHFWVTANGTGQSIEYVGDVGGKPLYQDNLKVVTVPGENGKAGTPTGVVFNEGNQFVVTQKQPGGSITAPARFLFAADNGVITAWTERKKADGTFDRPGDSVTVVDGRKNGSAFFGLGLSAANDKLYVADFGTDPKLRVYDSTFKDVTATGGFRNPFQREAAFKPGEYGPFNVQTIGNPGKASVFVAYAKTQPDPKNAKKVYAGEEDTGSGKGRLVEFDFNGRMKDVWQDRGLLNAPWGLALAPNNFGIYSNCFLVSNFGDGTIVAFDPQKKVALDYLRDTFGKPIKNEGIWGLQFGNGASLGQANHLYFAAGPEEEEDGIFGKLSPAKWFGQVPNWSMCQSAS